MIKISRRAIATAAAALAVGAGSVTWVATSASAATAKPAAMSARIQPCSASQLGVWVNADSGNGAAGTIYYHLDFTNTSGRTCYLYGWPGVIATNWAGGQLGQPARQVHDVKARVVNVPPGGTAHAALGYVDAQLSARPAGRRPPRCSRSPRRSAGAPGTRSSRCPCAPRPGPSRSGSFSEAPDLPVSAQ